MGGKTVRWSEKQCGGEANFRGAGSGLAGSGSGRAERLRLQYRNRRGPTGQGVGTHWAEVTPSVQ